jgi:hypothetical protein
MKFFLKSLDKKVWYSVEHGWTKPETLFNNWTKDKSTSYHWNNKGLDIIFITMSPDEFKRISMCEITKKTWDIIEVTHEGTKTMKNSKLQILTQDLRR